MSVFTYKKRTKNVFKPISRIPYGNITLNPYKIRPYTFSLVEGLNEQLNYIINNSPDSIDGQNGDILDNYIKNWENRARANLNTERTLRVGIINQISSARNANIKNAKDWLISEGDNLNQIKEELKKVQEKYDNEKNKCINW